MPPPKTRRVTASERRKRIEHAATRLFAERGYAATTVADIVHAAGVTKPMLYRHFESKQQLCVALLEDYRADLVAAPLAVFTPSAADVQVQLGSMVEAWLAYIEQHSDAARLLFTPISGDPEVERVQRDLYARQRATQVALLREFVPGLDAAEAEPLGEAMRASLSSIALWWLEHPEVGREVPLRALLRVTQGTVMALNRPSGRD